MANLEQGNRVEAGRTLRIGIDALSWNARSGYGRYCRELVSALVRLPTCHSFTLMLNADTPAPAGVEVLRVRPARKSAMSETRRAADLFRLIRTIMQAGVDVWFFPSPQTFAPVLSRARVIAVVHDTIPWRYPHLIFTNRAQQLAWHLKVAIAVRRSTYVLTVSEHARKSIAKYLRLPDSAIHVIGEAPAAVFKPNLDPSAVAKLSEQIGIPPDARMIVYHGALAPHKDVETLVNAFVRLSSAPEFRDVHLVIAGTSDWVNLRGAAVSLRNRCMSIERVRLPKPLDDTELALLLNRATIAVLPSLDEGFGLTGLEAVACGVPLIATRSSALPDVLGDGAVYFTPGAENELYCNMVSLLTDPAQRQRIRLAGAEKVATMSWEAEAQRLLFLFDELAASSQR